MVVYFLDISEIIRLTSRIVAAIKITRPLSPEPQQTNHPAAHQTTQYTKHTKHTAQQSASFKNPLDQIFMINKKRSNFLKSSQNAVMNFDHLGYFCGRCLGDLFVWILGVYVCVFCVLYGRKYQPAGVWINL